uniref:Uncharacterized protein n=1 Tax=Myotis myotis TaxID=51298 RepID=A0A7J7YE14_MYOMY|nr:hypothetical protein mMyoMyo1_011112 [Myotis myotis]
MPVSVSGPISGPGQRGRADQQLSPPDPERNRGGAAGEDRGEREATAYQQLPQRLQIRPCLSLCKPLLGPDPQPPWQSVLHHTGCSHCWVAVATQHLTPDVQLSLGLCRCYRPWLFIYIDNKTKT